MVQMASVGMIPPTTMDYLLSKNRLHVARFVHFELKAAEARCVTKDVIVKGLRRSKKLKKRAVVAATKLIQLLQQQFCKFLDGLDQKNLWLNIFERGGDKQASIMNTSIANLKKLGFRGVRQTTTVDLRPTTTV